MGPEGLKRHAKQSTKLILCCAIQSQTVSKEGNTLKRRLCFPFLQTAFGHIQVPMSFYRYCSSVGTKNVQAFSQRERLIPGSTLHCRLCTQRIRGLRGYHAHIFL